MRYSSSGRWKRCVIGCSAALTVGVVKLKRSTWSAGSRQDVRMPATSIVSSPGCQTRHPTGLRVLVHGRAGGRQRLALEGRLPFGPRPDTPGASPCRQVGLDLLCRPPPATGETREIGTTLRSTRRCCHPSAASSSSKPWAQRLLMRYARSVQVGGINVPRSRRCGGCSTLIYLALAISACKGGSMLPQRRYAPTRGARADFHRRRQDAARCPPPHSSNRDLIELGHSADIHVCRVRQSIKVGEEREGHGACWCPEPGLNRYAPSQESGGF